MGARGEERLLGNVLWSWGGHLVVVIGGFLLPRAIDRHAGSVGLGIWDLAWSAVAMLPLIELGVTSSVNRYVAKHLAQGDTAALNRTLSSVLCLQVALGVVMLVLTVAAAAAVPVLWAVQLGELAGEARWLILALGTSVAVSYALGAFAGAVTGCHRWDLHNAITAIGHAFSVTAMLVALRAGVSLGQLGLIYAACGLLPVAAHVVAARRVCPGLAVRWADVDRRSMATLLRFGGKTLSREAARSLLYQATSLLVLTFLGPQALAVYSRPLALVRHIRHFAAKLAYTLTPIASELQAGGGGTGLRELAVTMARAGALLALPPLVFLAVMGGPVLTLWMGPAYQRDLLPAVLALGHLATIATLPLEATLLGIDAHGRPALVSALGGTCCVIACWGALRALGAGLDTVVMLVGLTVTLVDGAYLTWFTCRTLGLPLPAFLRDAWGRPLASVVPFALWLVAARVALPAPEAVLVGGLGGGAVLGAIYWHWALPEALKRRLRATGLLAATAAPGITGER